MSYMGGRSDKGTALHGVAAIVLLYIFSNIFSAAALLFNGGVFTGGDFVGFRSEPAELLLNLLLVIIFYGLGLHFYRILRRKSDKNESAHPNVRAIGYFVFGVQLIFLLFISIGNVDLEQLKNEASFASYFQYLFVPDYLFLVYYPLSRGSKLFYVNLLIYLISTTLRGVSGGFIFLIFFEIIAASKKSKWSILAFVIAAVVLLSPLIFESRLLIRSASASYLFSTPPMEIFLTVVKNAYIDVRIGDALVDVGNFVLMRLQHLSSPVTIFNNIEMFWLGDMTGRFLPFLLDGSLQRIVLGGSLYNSPLLAEYLTLQLLPTTYGSWFIHPSLVGWLWVNPFLFPLLVAYCGFLCLINVALFRKLGAGEYAIACSHVFFIVFILNGWFGPYIFTIQALVLLWLLTKFLRAVSSLPPLIRRTARPPNLLASEMNVADSVQRNVRRS